MSLSPQVEHVFGCFGAWVDRIGDWTSICSFSSSKGVILFMMFYGAQCWASVLYLSMRLVEQDPVLVIRPKRVEDHLDHPKGNSPAYS